MRQPAFVSGPQKIAAIKIYKNNGSCLWRNRATCGRSSLASLKARRIYYLCGILKRTSKNRASFFGVAVPLANDLSFFFFFGFLLIIYSLIMSTSQMIIDCVTLRVETARIKTVVRWTIIFYQKIIVFMIFINIFMKDRNWSLIARRTTVLWIVKQV